jgi:hypothetical protein
MYSVTRNSLNYLRPWWQYRAYVAGLRLLLLGGAVVLLGAALGALHLPTAAVLPVVVIGFVVAVAGLVSGFVGWLALYAAASGALAQRQGTFIRMVTRDVLAGNPAGRARRLFRRGRPR